MARKQAAMKPILKRKRDEQGPRTVGGKEEEQWGEDR